MNALFLRHGKLLPPYDNYDNLSLQELRMLALGTCDPSIDKNFAERRVASCIDNGFLAKDAYDSIYCGSSTRSIETAGVLSKALGILRVEETHLLNEVAFDLESLVSYVEYQAGGMERVREAVFSAIACDNLVETHDDLTHRLSEIEKRIKTESGKNILFITHGFFMRLLQIFFLRKMQSFSVADLVAATNYSYLDGFSVVVKSNS